MSAASFTGSFQVCCTCCGQSEKQGFRIWINNNAMLHKTLFLPQLSKTYLSESLFSVVG